VNYLRPRQFGNSLGRCLCARFGPSLRNLRGEDGQALVESAISLVVTITLAFWLFELSMMTYTCTILNDATHEGMRYAILHGTDSTVCSGPDSACTDPTPYANVQAAVRNVTAISLHNMTAMTVTVAYPDSTAAPGNRVTVTTAYTYVPMLDFPGLAKLLTFTSTGRIIY
jgi:Flp pilus assembly protein TadG